MPRFNGTKNERNEAGRHPETPDSFTKRLGWFVLLWLAGIAAVYALAFGIRAVLIG